MNFFALIIYCLFVFNFLSGAVYSEELSASSGLAALSKEDQSHAYVQRIPYFVLVQRLKNSRDERADALIEQIDQLGQRLVIGFQIFV
jgi:hypothetical protein